MPRLVCDTDFLLKVANEPLPHLRAFVEDSGYSFTTIPQVAKELRGLACDKNRALARRASFALSLIGTKIQLIETAIENDPNMEADIALFETAKKETSEVLLATLDGMLLSRLERNRLPYLTLRKDKPFERNFTRASYLSARKS